MSLITPNTERAYRAALEAGGVLAGARVSTLAAWESEIEAMLGHGAGPRAIFDALRLRPEFNGSLSTIKRLCARLVRERGISPEEVAIPVLTPPGQVAQVDFGYVGRLLDPASGVRRKAWVFVMVLGFGRHMYAAITSDPGARDRRLVATTARPGASRSKRSAGHCCRCRRVATRGRRRGSGVSPARSAWPSLDRGSMLARMGRQR